MTATLICDSCGELIDMAQPYFEVTAVKLSFDNIHDPTLPNVQNTVEIPRTFHYHDGHQPQAIPEPEPEPEPQPEPEPEPEPTLSLDSLNPSTLTQEQGDVQVTATGTGFMDTAKIVFDGVELATAADSDTQLRFTVDSSPSGKGEGTYDVFVRQGGNDSNMLDFTIEYG